jgi:anaerobic magnesium-protoporphyrin IX monomethyl ester cyclase
MKILYLPSCRSQQRQFQKTNVYIYPVLLAMEAEWYRKHGHEVIWDKLPTKNTYIDKIITEPEGIEFLDLPRPDRVFTNAMDKKYQSCGNYKYLPGTHIQVANHCWWGRCSFCVEKDKQYNVRSVDSVIEEIKECKRLGFREVFDDSGTFPTGRWLDEFCHKVSKVDIRWGCNFRLIDADYNLMRNSGARMLLFGLESANADTLLKINKGVKCEDIKYIKKAWEAGLENHIAVMFGYPWETDEDAIRTLRLVHYLLKKGYAKTAQASFYTTGGEQGNKSHRKYVKRIYEVAYSPTFWFNKLRDIHNVDDLKYLWRAIKKGVQR